MKKCDKVSLISVMLSMCLIFSGCGKQEKWNNSHQSSDEGEMVLSIDKIVELSQKGNALSWSDFEPYNSMDIGSGLYILRYEINDDFYLLVGGGSKEKQPMYIRLVNADNKEEYIDIRTDDIESFIEHALYTEDAEEYSADIIYIINNPEDSDEIVSSYLSLNQENHTFIFSYDPLASYLSFGTYKLRDDVLIATTKDEKYEYQFKIADSDTLKFIQDNSSEIKFVNDEIRTRIQDGTEFKLISDKGIIPYSAE